jgi:RNA polymerase sigma-70 factor (family 1)
MNAAETNVNYTPAGVRQRNEEYISFEKMFQQHYNPLCRYALRFTQCRFTAEEIVSEVFFKMWKNRESHKVHTSVYGYLVFATRNACIDFLRSKSRRGGRADELCSEFQANDASPSELLIGNETQRLIERAIDSLSPNCKQIFLMSRDAKMTYAEIAAAMDLSIKTVEAHMSRTLKTLRARLLEADKSS